MDDDYIVIGGKRIKRGPKRSRAEVRSFHAGQRSQAAPVPAAALDADAEREAQRQFALAQMQRDAQEQID